MVLQSIIVLTCIIFTLGVLYLPVRLLQHQTLRPVLSSTMQIVALFAAWPIMFLGVGLFTEFVSVVLYQRQPVYPQWVETWPQWRMWVLPMVGMFACVGMAIYEQLKGRGKDIGFLLPARFYGGWVTVYLLLMVLPLLIMMILRVTG